MIRPTLLAALLVSLVSSCAPEPPPMVQAIAGPDPPRPSSRQGQPEDVCAIYRWMFPASVIAPLDSIYGDPRLSTRTEGGDATPAEVRAIRAALVEAGGGEGSPWATISEDVLAEAFRSWRPGPLPDCDWMGFARAVSAPARNGRIEPVLIDEESGSYTRVSRPFFLDRDTALVLVREVIDDGRRVTRKLVFTYRDDDDWLMLPRTIEERSAPTH